MRRPNIVAIYVSMCFQTLHKAQMRYMVYICDIPCLANWVIFNQCYDLLRINDCKPTGTLSVFQIKISTFEASERYSLRYGTIFIKSTYSFAFLYAVFSSP